MKSTWLCIVVGCVVVLGCGGRSRGQAPAKEPVALTAGEIYAPDVAPLEGFLSFLVPDAPPLSIDFARKGDKLRVGLWRMDQGARAEGAVEIVDRARGKLKLLLTDGLVFAERDLEAQTPPSPAGLPVERRGPGEVAGVRCEEWTLAERDYRVNVCVVGGARGLDVPALERSVGAELPPWLRTVLTSGYLPLRIEIRDVVGRARGRTAEAEGIGSFVSDATFTVPDSYNAIPWPKAK